MLTKPTTRLPPEVEGMLRQLGKTVRAVGNIQHGHEVELCGAGKGSVCDLFANVKIDESSYALVVEVKQDARKEETIEDWLNVPIKMRYSPKNRMIRLSGLFKALELGNPFRVKPVVHRNILYRPMHRTVSALEKGKSPKYAGAIMIIRSFSNDPFYLKNFQKFCDLFKIKFRPRLLKRAVSPRFASPNGKSPGEKPLFLGLVEGQSPSILNKND